MMDACDRSAAAAIAERLARMLSAEVELAPEVVRFIDSTFADPDPAGLERLLADPSDPERDGLAALLFSPDEAHQLAIEPLLAAAVGAVDEEDVARRVARAAGRVRFRLPDGRGVVAVGLTPELAAGFVQRLALNRDIPPELRAALQPIADERERLRALVATRNSGVRCDPARLDLLIRAIGRPEAGDGEFCDYLAFALERLEAVATDAELWNLMTGRKRRLIEALEQARQQDEQLARSGFEVLQSRGRRLGFVDRAAAERELRFIDRLGLAVFGRLPHADVDCVATVFDAGDLQQE